MGYGVIGNTADSGSVVLGSSPGTPANDFRPVGRKFVVFQRASVASRSSTASNGPSTIPLPTCVSSPIRQPGRWYAVDQQYCQGGGGSQAAKRICSSTGRGFRVRPNNYFLLLHLQLQRGELFVVEEWLPRCGDLFILAATNGFSGGDAIALELVIDKVHQEGEQLIGFAR